MTWPRSQIGRVAVPAAALCALALAAVWISYARQRAIDREDTVRFAVERNSNLAVALEESAIRLLHTADAVLQVVKMQYATDGESLDLPNLERRLSISPDVGDCVSVIGPDGRVRLTSAAARRDPADFSSFPFFVLHTRVAVDSLFISRPLVSPLTGKTVIVISRRLYDKNGGFGGAVALELPPSSFTSFYAKARLLPNDIISLVAPDGVTYARRTGGVESSGEDIHKSPLFRHLERRTDSFYFAPDALRHIPTWFSYRRLQGYAIIATVGSAEADILADFTARQTRFLELRLVLSLLLLLFSFAAAAFLLHRRKQADRLLQEEDKYRRLLTQQMIAVQEREREWIGRELHDNVNQVLTTVKLYLEMVEAEGVHPLVRRSRDLVSGSITEIRNLSHQLAAPTLGTRSLVDSINALLETVGSANRLRFTFDYSGYTRVVMSQKLALYRILQEQITNIVKHAQATHAWITLCGTGGNVTLTVKDNGKGFDATKTFGMGLNNIISRAKVFDGTARIETAPQKGCVLTVTLPLTAVEACSTS